jgi:hypothetical protein
MIRTFKLLCKELTTIQRRSKSQRIQINENIKSISKAYFLLFMLNSYLRSGILKRKDINRLVFSLKIVYLKFRTRYDNGDDIFEAMVDHIIPPDIDDEEYQAYCTLVCYFFHTCEVFENVDPT